MILQFLSKFFRAGFQIPYQFLNVSFLGYLLVRWSPSSSKSVILTKPRCANTHYECKDTRSKKDSHSSVDAEKIKGFLASSST